MVRKIKDLEYRLIRYLSASIIANSQIRIRQERCKDDSGSLLELQEQHIEASRDKGERRAAGRLSHFTASEGAGKCGASKPQRVADGFHSTSRRCNIPFM